MTYLRLEPKRLISAVDSLGVNSFSLRYHALVGNYYMVSFPLRFRPNLEVCSWLHVIPCAYRSLNQFTIFSFHASLLRKLGIWFWIFAAGLFLEGPLLHLFGLVSLLDKLLPKRSVWVLSSYLFATLLGGWDVSLSSLTEDTLPLKLVIKLWRKLASVWDR